MAPGRRGGVSPRQAPGRTACGGRPVPHRRTGADPGTGEQTGTAVTRVVVAQVAGDDATFILDCTVRLPEGNLAFYGAESFSSFAGGVTYTVVGGTGRYQGARGVVNITGGEVAGQAGSLLSFDTTRR